MMTIQDSLFVTFIVIQVVKCTLIPPKTVKFKNKSVINRIKSKKKIYRNNVYTNITY